MGESNWTAYVGILTALSTELNSLANGSNAITASAIDNSSNRDFYLDVELYLASVDLSAQTNPAIYIWTIKRLDGTNYEDGGASVTPAREPTLIIPVRAINGAQRIIPDEPMLMRPGSFHLLFGNRTGVALAATGNTFKYDRFSEYTG